MGKIRKLKMYLYILSVVVGMSVFFQTRSQESNNMMPPPSVLQNLNTMKGNFPAETAQPQTPEIKSQEQKAESSTKDEKSVETKEELQTKKDMKTQIVEYKDEISELENMFNKTYRDLLKNKSLSQFGYSFFKTTEEDRVVPAGDDYVIGPNDRLKVYLWGDPVDVLAVNRELDLTVSREGNVYIPSIGVVGVTGLSIGAFKNILRQKFNSKFRNLNIEVILTNPRKMNIYVTGFVNKPGMVTATPFDTIVTAIAKAGGVSKAGTLRKIQLKRKDGGKLNTVEIDFYDLFIKGVPVDINLRDGDIIHVPPIGDVVAIFGDIKRPGIYELKSESSLEDILVFAGGFNPSVSEVMVRVSRYSKDGVKLFEGSLEDKNFLKTRLYNGDFVYFGPKPEVFENSVVIQGDVYYPGIYSINDTKTLKEILLKAKPLINADYGKLIRVDKTILDFKIEDVLTEKVKIDLKPLDSITVYNKYYSLEPIYLAGEVKSPKTIPFYNNITVMDVLRNVEFNYSINKLKLYIIREQKIYKTIYLFDLLVRFDDSQNINLSPGDTLVVKKTEDIEKAPSVTVLGEVKNPGKYMLHGNEKLSDIIKQAGGYTDKAYPQALIFIRESAKKLQKEQLETTFLTLQEEFLKKSQGLAAASQEEREAYSQAIEKSKAELEILKRKAEFGLGRIALEIPKTLEELEKSNQNISLQDGDTIIVPPKPNYVLVLGDVYNQVSLPYIEGYRLKDYLNMVGGYRKDADRKGVYVIKANGRVVSSENFSRGFLISSGLEDYKLSEGDTIVVPSEIKVPILWRPLIKDVVQIIFQSISTAVLARRL